MMNGACEGYEMNRIERLGLLSIDPIASFHFALLSLPSLNC
jgi:hypothetical protein